MKKVSVADPRQAPDQPGAAVLALLTLLLRLRLMSLLVVPVRRMLLSHVI